MNAFIFLVVGGLAGGQAGNNNPGQFNNADGADSKFKDSVFKVPLYHGAKMIAGSSQRIGIEQPKGWMSGWQRRPRGGWGRAYETADNYKLVEAYYRKKGKILGKFDPEFRDETGSGFRLRFNLPKREALVVYGSKRDIDGMTQFEVYYLLEGPTPTKNY